MKRALAASLVVLALAACGETRGERALTGGAIGAGAGAAIGAITGLGPVTGAIAGGAGGAAVGAFTPDRDCDDVNDRPTRRC